MPPGRISGYGGPMKYTLDYGETVTLSDGLKLRVRAIRPSDKEALVDAFGRLSVEARRKRFFTTKNELSERELHFLTECDGIDHYALVAGLLADGEETEGVGVARFVRVAGEPRVAELAVVVVDDWQRRGIGTLLLERIAAAAAERDIESIRALAQPDNEQVRALIGNHAEEVKTVQEHGMLEMTIRVPPASQPDSLTAMLSMLRMPATGALAVPIWLGRRTLGQLLALDRKSDEAGGDDE